MKKDISANDIAMRCLLAGGRPICIQSLGI